MSVQDLSQIGTVLVDEQVEVRLRGFALAFDRLAKEGTFDFNLKSSSCISEVSCSLSSSSLLLKSVTNLFIPWEILTHAWDLSLFTQFPLHIYLAGSSLWLPTRARFWCSFESNLSGKMIFHLLAKCTDDKPLNGWIVRNSSVSFVVKYCPTSTVVENLASVQISITRFCFDSLPTRSWYLCNRSSCEGSSVEGVSVFVNKLAAPTMGQIVLPVQVSPFWHGRLCIPHTNLRLLRK